MATDNIIKVSQEELRQTATKIEGMAGDYQVLYKKLLDTDLVGELGNAWKGEDADSYISKVKSFQANFEQMYNLMMDYVYHLREAANDYDTTQDTLATEAQNHKYMN